MQYVGIWSLRNTRKFYPGRKLRGGDGTSGWKSRRGRRESGRIGEPSVQACRLPGIRSILLKGTISLINIFRKATSGTSFYNTVAGGKCVMAECIGGREKLRHIRQGGGGIIALGRRMRAASGLSVGNHWPW
jgi:hypothetical protein